MITKFENVVEGKEVVIYAEQALSKQVNTLFLILETFGTTEIDFGKSFEIGFTVFIIKELNGQYVVHAPDYTSNPFVDFTEDLTLHLEIMAEQTHILKVLSAIGETTRYDDKVVYSEGVFETDGTYMERIETDSKRDSGWFYGKREGDNSDLKACYAYQLLQLNRKLVQYLGLPAKYLVVFDGETVVAILNENNDNVFRELNN